MAKLSMRNTIFCTLLCMASVALFFLNKQIHEIVKDALNWALLERQPERLIKPTCANVLDRAVVGGWIKREVSQQEKDEYDNFNKLFRAEEKIKPTFQRKDGRCGNVDIDGVGPNGDDTASFRALCDPNGTVPCCFENKCVSKSVEECRCEHCYDMRQVIHPDLSTWIPADPTCQIMEFQNKDDACKLLENVTIYFIGDSLVHQLYLGVISLVRKKDPYSPLKADATPEQRKVCVLDKYSMLLDACWPHTISDTLECGNRTRLRDIGYWNVGQTETTLQVIRELHGRPNTFFVLNAGIHYQFNMDLIKNQVLAPILNQLSNISWPVPIWMTASSFGILKTPMHRSLQNDNVLKFNPKMNELLRNQGVAVLDVYPVTKNTLSIDGMHYGPGTNALKETIGGSEHVVAEEDDQYAVDSKNIK